MHRYIFLFGYKILTYDIVVPIAAAIGFFYFSQALLKLNIKKWQVVSFSLLGFAIFFWGEALIRFFYELVFFQRAPWSNVYYSPMHSICGPGPLMIAFTIVCIKIYQWPSGKVLDCGAIALMMASSFARIGCFLNGCSGGKPCDLPWAIAFPSAPQIRVHPTQIYMFFLEMILWLFLLFFNNRKKQYDGQTFWIGLLLYSIYKFGIEFVRTHPVFILGLTHAQVMTIPMFFLAIWALRSRGKKLNDAQRENLKTP